MTNPVELILLKGLDCWDELNNNINKYQYNKHQE